MNWWRQVTTISVLTLWSVPALAIQINDFSPADNERFASGYPSGPLVANTDSSFIGLGYNWSGVGWNASNNAAPIGNMSFGLITPRQVLIANHYQPGVGSSIEFASASGQVTMVTVQSQPGAHGGDPAPDMATAQFSNPIPQSAGITPYPILFQGYNASVYEGDNLLFYGQTAAVGLNQIGYVDTGTNLGFQPPNGPDPAYYMEYYYNMTAPNFAQLQGGDSGSPSFITLSSSPRVLYLAGGHYLDEAGWAGFDTFLPMSLPALDADTSPAGYLPLVVTPTTAAWTATGSVSWGARSNWSSDAVPDDVLSGGSVTTCASVLFNGLLGSQHSVTLSNTESVTSLVFSRASTATSGFSFSGNSLTLGEAGLTNNDVHTQTFNNAIILRASQQWQAGAGGVTISASGSLNLGTNQLLYLDSSGTSNFRGVVSGQGSGIAKDGSGRLILGNAANSFSGPIFVHNGTLQFTSIQFVGSGNSALAAPTSVAAGTIYLAGALAYVGSGSSSDRVIDVADGPGATGATGIINASGSGPLNLSGGVICENASGTSLLVLQGAGSGSQSGAIVNGSDTANVMSLVKTGSGVWNLSGANTYSGTTAVNGGLLTISGPNGGIAQSTALTVSCGTLQLDDSALPNNFSSSRLGGQPISLQGGALQLRLGNASGGTESIGSITAVAGENTLAVSAGSGGGILSGGSLTRMPGAALNFTGA